MLLSYLYPVRNSPEKRTWKMILSQNAWKMRNEHFLEKTKDLPSLQVIGVPSWCVQQNTSGQMCHNSFDYYDNLSGWRQKQIDKCVRFKSKIHPVCKSQEQIELDLLIFQRTQHNATSRKNLGTQSSISVWERTNSKNLTCFFPWFQWFIGLLCCLLEYKSCMF